MRVLFPNLLAVVLGAATAFAFTCDCGAKSFTDKDISSAIETAESSGSGSLDPGSASEDQITILAGYPHRFNNREKLALPWCQGSNGPFMEYPLKQGRPYRGGPPGADRVIYTSADAEFCGCITHTGASGNNFVLCDNFGEESR